MRAASQKADIARQTSPVRKLKILIAEDNKINQKYITAVLGKTGYEITVVEDGLQAVEAVRGRDFDVVLMDVQMPVLDGEQATKQIRALPTPKCDVPIIALTAHAMSGARQECLDAGMDDYLSKPINSAALLSKLVDIGLLRTDLHDELPNSDERPTGDTKEFDPTQLEALRNILNPGKFAEHLTLLLETFMPTVDRLGTYLQAGDLAHGGLEAHNLVSIAGNYGARTVSAVAREVEQACKRSDGITAADRFKVLQPAASDAANTFDQFRKRVA
jgi:CheY-like chemotaxis protein